MFSHTIRLEPNDLMEITIYFSGSPMYQSYFHPRGNQKNALKAAYINAIDKISNQVQDLEAYMRLDRLEELKK